MADTVTNPSDLQRALRDDFNKIHTNLGDYNGQMSGQEKARHAETAVQIDRMSAKAGKVNKRPGRAELAQDDQERKENLYQIFNSLHADVKENGWCDDDLARAEVRVARQILKLEKKARPKSPDLDRRAAALPPPPPPFGLEPC